MKLLGQFFQFAIFKMAQLAEPVVFAVFGRSSCADAAKTGRCHNWLVGVFPHWIGLSNT